jgi:oxalate decarboxylase/phosphoglucose isomerase-like protein (cupin superfamily)
VVIETVLPAGAMTPLHAHDEDEALQAVDGRIAVFLPDEVVTLGAGGNVLVPRGVAHTLRAETDARLISATYVSSASRYEDFLRALAPARAGEPAPLIPEEGAGLAAVAERNGIVVLGPPGLLPASARVRAA